jgi:succinate dehydrogenase / fumarate reductase cytochrome b subunit
MAHSARPVSPHLQIYKPQLTSVLSIMHRITGVGAFLGSVCVMLWLVSLAWDASLYGFLQIVVVSIPVQILLFLWTLSFIYHLLNGVRHLVWDAGKGLELPEIYKSGKIVMILALAITVLIWIIRLAS